MAITQPETTVRTTTLASAAIVDGVTLFTAAKSRICISPAEPGHGWRFRRTDLPSAPEFPVRADRVREEARRTVLVLDPTDPRSPSVQTVEHLLSALAGLGVTDARIDVDGPEIPIGDGSARPFVDAIDRAGLVHSGGSVVPLVITTPVRVEADSVTWIEATPPRPGDPPGLTLEYHLDYHGMPGMTPAIEPSLCGRRGFIARAFFSDDPSAREDYRKHIAPARTFSLAAEAEAARRTGLFTHLTPRDMIVLGPDGPIDNSLRFEDEPIRHKLLDLLGDVAAVGRPIMGRIVAHRTGHAMNNRLARRLIGA
ncbi:MAG: UDP-3-O-acyl-N-acetylglucosamine deacetylase [Phycisphaeraceae bacterium]|nr:UDP-3-O-acyl-N-acetylglucosamine deacetylase [Phycisphaeraceae bacterium]